MKTFQTIDSYIKSFPKEIQETLQIMHQTIKKAAPQAEEAIKYGIPTFIMHGNLVHFGGFKKHVGFFPTPAAITAFKSELQKYKTTKGTIQFPWEEPLPLGLITKIVKFRVRQNKEKHLAKPKK